MQSEQQELQRQLENLTQAEQEYLDRIHELETKITISSKSTNKNMQSRIRELEAMLATEKARVAAMQPISIIDTVGVGSSVPKKAANSSTRRKKKKA